MMSCLREPQGLLSPPNDSAATLSTQCPATNVPTDPASPNSRASSSDQAVVESGAEPSRPPLFGLTAHPLPPRIDFPNRDETLLSPIKQMSSVLLTGNLGEVARAIQQLHTMLVDALHFNSMQEDEVPMILVLRMIKCDVMGLLLGRVVPRQSGPRCVVVKIMAASLFDLIALNTMKILDNEVQARSMFANMLKFDRERAALSVEILFKLCYKFRADHFVAAMHDSGEFHLLVERRLFPTEQAKLIGRPRLVQALHRKQDLKANADIICNCFAAPVREHIIYSPMILGELRQLLLKPDLGDDLRMKTILLLNLDCSNAIATACDIGIVTALKPYVKDTTFGRVVRAIIRNYIRYCNPSDYPYFREQGLMYLHQ